MNALTGKCLLITRAADQCGEVVGLAEARGATARCLPCLAVQCLDDAIRKGVARLPEGAVIVLSSANGVRCTAEALAAEFVPLFSRHPVVAVGEYTAKALAVHGVRAAWVAREASQDGLVRSFAEHDLPADVCFLRAEQGRDALSQALQAQGVKVTLIHAYRTVCPEGDASGIVRALQQDEIDAVLLGSSRTAAHYVRRIGDVRLADRPAVAVISPQVAAAAEAQGLSVQAVAKQASFPAMLDALADYFARPRSETEEKRP